MIKIKKKIIIDLDVVTVGKWDKGKYGDFEEIFKKILNREIKEEDITLIFVSSLREAVLVTFNKIHLKNKEPEINEILSEYGLKTIKIISPEQI